MTVFDGNLKRSNGGRFAPGRGGFGASPNGTTTDLRLVRREIAESWQRCDGPKLLDQLAIDYPLSYLKLVVAVLPRGWEDDAALPDLTIVVACDTSPHPPMIESVPPHDNGEAR